MAEEIPKKPLKETKKSSPVEVKNTEPIDVSVFQAPDEALRMTTAAKVDAAADATKASHDVEAKTVSAKAVVDAKALATEDQRRISGIWERTQQVIALTVVLCTLAVAGFKAVWDALSDPTRGIAAGPAFLFLVAASNLVIGFYFGRTNHSRIGGVGSETQSASRDGSI